MKRHQSNQSDSKSESSSSQSAAEKNRIIAYYISAVAVAVFGLSYASVPLYKVFCAMTGFGGTTRRAEEPKAITVKPVENGKLIRIDFTSNVHSSMPWSFVPTQKSIRILPGETALAFYTVKNPTKKTITGVATYNVYPPKAGLYFNKIQCFCFEEQRLGPEEEIDMPVFFFIDPEIINDPAMKNVTNITLAYTFFKTGEDELDATTSMKTATNTESVI
jgi:cytochrome c oxidase assembly protein subunit 11